MSAAFFADVRDTVVPDRDGRSGLGARARLAAREPDELVVQGSALGAGLG
jgi:hypothetical protein